MSKDNRRCIWRLFVCMHILVTVGIFVVKRALLKIVVYVSLGVEKHVVCLCRGCDGCCEISERY